VHLDGARIFNAAVALKSSVADVAECVDSVMFCLSKGLGAPVGSMLCGTSPFIAEARRVRKMFGGGMRQAGVLAAAGLIALRDGPSRLEVDHERARILGSLLERIPGIRLLSPPVETNIVMVEISRGSAWDVGAPAPAAAFVADLADRGLLALEITPRRVRLVTHRDVAAGPFEAALRGLEELAESAAARR
jgi:threonine aldolase